MFQDRYTDGESVKLTANGDGNVKVVFESASWGTFTVESATATKEGEEYGANLCGCFNLLCIL